MTGIVVDASVFAPFLLPDESDDALGELEDIISRNGALVPQHWPLEIANLLLMAVRRKRAAPDIVDRALLYAQDSNIVFDDQTIPYSWTVSLSLAQRHGLTIYDAAYLELAKRQGLPLATLNKRLIAAAQAKAVDIFA
jgi:predicted nucleic acid-binding protein